MIGSLTPKGGMLDRAVELLEASDFDDTDTTISLLYSLAHSNIVIAKVLVSLYEQEARREQAQA